jgi:hypothetical protein
MVTSLGARYTTLLLCRHGDLFYLEPTRYISNAFELGLTDISTISTHQSSNSIVAFSGWSHAEIYRRIREFAKTFGMTDQI